MPVRYRSSKIHDSTYVWNKTMPEWVPLTSEPELLAMLTDPPPAAHSEMPAPPKKRTHFQGASPQTDHWLEAQQRAAGGASVVSTTRNIGGPELDV